MSEGASDFIKGLGQQTKDVWAALSVPQRVTFLMFVAASVLLSAVTLFWSSNPNYVPLLSNLPPDELSSASARLRDVQIPFRYEASRGALSVPAGNLEDAQLALADLGLGGQGHASEGFELFDKQSFGMTDFAQKVNYLRALQGSLERKITALDGIETAHVTLTLPKDELFVRNQQPPKASVEIKIRRRHQITASHVTAIRHIVSAAVPKLSPQHVAVVDGDGRMLAKFQDANDPTLQAGEQLEARMQSERYLQEKVEALLDHALGTGRAAVQVAVEMNFEAVERRVQKMDPDSGVILQESIKSDDAATPALGQVRAASVRAGAGGEGETASVAPMQTKTQKTVSNQYHYDTVTETVKPEIGGVKRLSVAVLVKPRAVGTLDKPAFEPLSEAEITRLTEVIKNAVGFSAERKDLVKVENAPEPGGPELAYVPLAPIAQPSGMSEWVDHLPNILLVVGMLVVGMVFWQTMKRLGTSSESFTASAQNESAVSTLNQPPATRTATKRRSSDVQDLVSGNTTQATQIIRSLLSK